MKVAVVGTRTVTVFDLEKYLPRNTTEIISGGAEGVNTCAREYALAYGIKLTEFLPDYEKYGEATPLERNILIIEHAEMALAFWDGRSKGTKHPIESCRKMGVPYHMYAPPDTIS